MSIEEIKRDLFSAPEDHALAHCVARDLRMAKGIAAKFRSKFKRIEELKSQNVGVGGCAALKVDSQYIFYLVTKELSYKKPTYQTLQNSLDNLKAKCIEYKICKLAMPRIGCGLDGLHWGRVKEMVTKTFNNLDIRIGIYEFNEEGLTEWEMGKPNFQTSKLPTVPSTITKSQTQVNHQKTRVNKHSKDDPIERQPRQAKEADLPTDVIGTRDVASPTSSAPGQDTQPTTPDISLHNDLNTTNEKRT
ncbi:ADP-ribose glycohydrolase OARD1-like [Macrosteles quadrilineatus]|uniref:ADP-ribose glycohydrolase OARD1-like n=1 Tax=Macrosteles quadrilineatus TaxID=74068 RepID=UPI0023E33272|nr:ADP-ribose glycohydrolase OARD1-like [Macrosteles quadrilineatus]